MTPMAKPFLLCDNVRASIVSEGECLLSNTRTMSLRGGLRRDSVEIPTTHAPARPGSRSTELQAPGSRDSAGEQSPHNQMEYVERLLPFRWRHLHLAHTCPGGQCDLPSKSGVRVRV